MKIIKSKLKYIFSLISRFLIKCRFIPQRVIIKMDGGICSQMHFYLIGKIIENSLSKPVYFDLTWFKENGKDIDGKFCRNFDLLKIFHDLEFKSQPKNFLCRLYISCFYKWNDYKTQSTSYIFSENIQSPCYLDGYFQDPEIMYSKWFRKCFKIDTDVLPSDNLEILNKIEKANINQNSCAVHVRRGDLAKENSIYGHPCSIEYYLRSFQLIEKNYPGTHFFVFSDEPQWIRDNLLPSISKYNIEIIDLNGSDRGWCDLILMSKCHYQITSQGSMGKYAAMLRDESKRDGIVILPENEFSGIWQKRFVNAVINTI